MAIETSFPCSYSALFAHFAALWHQQPPFNLRAHQRSKETRNVELSTMTATDLRADAQYSQLEVVPSSHDTGNILAVANPKLSDNKGVEEANASTRRPFWHRKWIWVTLLVIVIGAVVAGAVGGVLSKRKCKNW
jgi:anti-sigma-K factor RskA